MLAFRVLYMITKCVWYFWRFFSWEFAFSIKWFAIIELSISSLNVFYSNVYRSSVMSGEIHIYLCTSLGIVFMLHNRSHICHKEYDVVPNQRRLDCLLNRLFRHRSKKISKLRVTGLCDGNSPVTAELPAKGPVTRKMFPFHDVFMNQWHLHVSLSQTGGRVICLESHGDKGVLFRFVSHCIKGLWWWYIAKT